MNIDEYEKNYQAIYSEFSSIIKYILEKAIAQSSSIVTFER